VLVPRSQDPLQPGDELFFVTSQDVEGELEELFSTE
jgi:Trk K+ transport system NAD-binding subunit